VVGDVDDVDPGRAEARDDQMGAVGPVAGGAAAVPAVVVELVAHVRHRRLVDDLAVLGVDDGEEVRRVDARPLVQAGDVEELLVRGLKRLLGRGEEGGRPVVVVMVLHETSFSKLKSPRVTTSALWGRKRVASPACRPGSTSSSAMRRRRASMCTRATSPRSR